MQTGRKQNQDRIGDDKTTTQEQIKIAAIHAGISITDLAERFGTSQANFSKRLKVGKFTRAEMEKIAEILGCSYISVFRFPDGKEY